VIDISDDQFSAIIGDAMDTLPQKYIERLDNVAITYADEPDIYQRQKVGLKPWQTLLGLYEGVPLTQRGAGYNLVLPDKITIFKLPIARSVDTLEAFKEEVRHTLWHEIAHYYGLDHLEIEKREK
jgi:predicted Zn-dependent protease with MMP-like domain